jgi:hypothetical protein
MALKPRGESYLPDESFIGSKFASETRASINDSWNIPGYSISVKALLPALIQGFGGADTVAFSAQFAFRGGGAGALLAGTRLCLGQFLAPA